MRHLVVTAIALLPLFGCQSETPQGPQAAKYDWVQVETGALDAGAVLPSTYPLNEARRGKTRLTFTAERPVIIGIASKRDADRMMRPPAPNEEPFTMEKTALACSRPAAIAGTKDCEAHGQSVLYVRSDRSLADAASLFSPGTISQAISNRVSFTLSEWRCVANCN